MPNYVEIVFLGGEIHAAFKTNCFEPFFTKKPLGLRVHFGFKLFHFMLIKKQI